MSFSESQIDDFIATERRFHPEGLTREKAIEYMHNRAFCAAELQAQEAPAPRLLSPSPSRIQNSNSDTEDDERLTDSIFGTVCGLSEIGSAFSGGGGDFGGGGADSSW